MASEPTQRSYRAPCPGCGAPVEFRSAQSTHAVCSFCRSTVARSGDKLARVGKMAEVFQDYSPLQLMAAGRWRGKVFTLVGRLQYKGEAGTWTEWSALFDDGTVGVLAEDNGSYVFSVAADMGREVPEARHLRVGATTAIGDQTYTVASNLGAALISAQGELPKLPPLGETFPVAELRSADGEVVSIDYGPNPPQVSRGRAVALEELQLTGLRDDNAAQEEKGRQFACPNCGSPVTVTLESTKSISCGSCNSLIDVSQGIGGELRHAMQDEPVQPVIALGSTGQLQGLDWQVVGYQHRMGQEPGDDESFGWEEYLLYNRKRGFAFLVDSEEGWSLVRPTTGSPSLGPNGKTAVYQKAGYQLQYSYNAETTYVAGEFYWPVERGQKTFNRDFAKGRALLSMEQTPKEVTWSIGSRIDSAKVAEAFKVADKHGDSGPTTPKGTGGGTGCGTIVLWIIMILILLLVIKACVDDESSGSGGSGYRSSGGSYGGYSGGGGHK